MSSVSSKNDEIRRNREEYQNREAKLNKKHKKEIVNLVEGHDEEVQKIQENQEAQLQHMQKRHKEIMSSRDLKYQNEIEDLRSIYKDQMQKKLSEADQRRSAAIESGRAALAKEKQVDELQKERLRTTYETTINQKEKTFGDLTKEMRDSLQTKVNEQRDKMNMKNDTQVNHLNIAFDKEKAQLIHDKNQLKSLNDIRVKDLDKHYDARVNKLSSNFADQIQSNNRQYSNLMRDKDIQAQEINNTMRDKYSRVYNEKAQKNADSIEEFKDSVRGRIERDIRSKEFQIRNLKDGKTADGLANGRLRQIERNNIIREYEAKLKDLESQRDGAVEVSNDLTHKRVNEIVHKNDKLQRTIQRDAQSRLNMKDVIHRADRSQTEAFYQAELERTKTKSQEAVQKNMQVTRAEQGTLVKQYENAIDQMKDSYKGTLQSVREKEYEDKTQLQIRLSQKTRDIEKKYQDKLNNMETQYENLISDMKEAHQKDIKNAEYIAKMKIKERDKGHKSEIDNLKQRYDLRLSKLEDSNSRTLDRIQLKHSEEIENIARRVEYSNRKV